MAIEANYVKKINEIIEVQETLSAFETKFIFGDAEGRPILERNSISDKQKAMIDRIYNERVKKLDRQNASTIEFGNPRVSAIQSGGQKTYQVCVDKKQVGPVVNFSEATNVVSWLSALLNDADVLLDVGATPEAGDDAGGRFPGEPE